MPVKQQQKKKQKRQQQKHLQTNKTEAATYVVHFQGTITTNIKKKTTKYFFVFHGLLTA